MDTGANVKMGRGATQKLEKEKNKDGLGLGRGGVGEWVERGINNKKKPGKMNNLYLWIHSPHPHGLFSLLD